MNISLNGNEISVSEIITLQQLLSEHNLHLAKGIAVAVNNQVVSKNSWEKQEIRAGDKILVIKASQGG